eukprot:scaffold3870_cov246-Pinguiococcus_pyrenoidosus.AAC.6
MVGHTIWRDLLSSRDSAPSTIQSVAGPHGRVHTCGLRPQCSGAIVPLTRTLDHAASARRARRPPLLSKLLDRLFRSPWLRPTKLPRRTLSTKSRSTTPPRTAGSSSVRPLPARLSASSAGGAHCFLHARQ